MQVKHQHYIMGHSAYVFMCVCICVCVRVLAFVLLCINTHLMPEPKDTESSAYSFVLFESW
jgi:hypothetical protein